MSDANVTGAFSEEHAGLLSGASRSQLRRWDRIGLLKPSYAEPDRRTPYSRIYSFLDVVSLRVLNGLRNVHRVSLRHLREVSAKLTHLGEQRWTATTLYVIGRRVVWDDPRTGAREDVVARQRVFDIPLRVAISDTREAIRDSSRRGPGDLGRIEQHRSILANAPVFARTRVPVTAVRNYLAAGFDDASILREYPQLTADDIAAARAQGDDRIAA